MAELMSLAAMIGIDWSDRYHDISLQESGAPTVEHRRIAHTPEAIVEWIVELRSRFPGSAVGIAVRLRSGWGVNPRSAANADACLQARYTGLGRLRQGASRSAERAFINARTTDGGSTQSPAGYI